MISPTLMLAGALLAAPTGAQHPCRALVNLDDGLSAAPSSGHVVLDVRFGGAGTPVVNRQVGLAIGEGRTIRQLRTVHDADHAKRSGTVWSVLEGMDPATQVVTRWAGRPVSAEPSDHDSMDYYGVYPTAVIASFGKYLTVSSGGAGYAGGAHMFDDGDWSLLSAPDGKPIDPLSLVDASAALASARAVTAKAGLEEPPEMTRAELAKASLRPEKNGLTLVETVFCCSWAENHNQFELEAPVAVPKALEAVIPHDASGWVTGPASCRLRHADAKLMLASAAGTQHTIEAAGTLVGLAWVEPSAPPLRPFKADAAGAKQAMKRARKLLKVDNDAPVATALAQRATTLAPDDLGLAVEAAWVHFTATSGADVDAAEQLTRRALARIPAANTKLIGMARYNLGRILEKKGNLADARAQYELSLKARPHKVVKARLESLPKP